MSTIEENNSTESNDEAIELVSIPFYKPDVFIKVKGFCLPSFVRPNLDKIKQFKYEKSDVFVASYPKSGTTWTQEIVYLIMNDCNFKKASEKKIDQRVPFIEFPEYGVDYIDAMTERPRLIKTHLPLSFLPDNIANDCKIVYVIRNPRDTEVSHFHFINGISNTGFSGTFDNYIDNFLNGSSSYGPWWNHIDDFSSKPNVHVIYYEQLHSQPFETIKSISQYLGKNLSDEQINSIIEWSRFDKMKENKAVNYEWYNQSGFLKEGAKFYRKGKVGDWINHFASKQQVIDFDKVVNANLKSKHTFNYGWTDEEVDKFYEAKRAAAK